MEMYDEALQLALKSGSRFDVEERSAYVETLIAKCIDGYIAVRRRNAEARVEDQQKVDERLERVVEQMFGRCMRDEKYTQAIGIAIEARREDEVANFIKRCPWQDELLTFTLDLAEKTIANKQFRSVILRLVANFLKDFPMMEKHSFKLCRCYVSLNDYEELASLLTKWHLESKMSSLVALQIAFDLFDSENQQLVSQVVQKLKQRQFAETDPSNQRQLQRLVNVLLGAETYEIYRRFLSESIKTDGQIATGIKDAIPQTVSALQEACVWANGLLNACTMDDNFLKLNIEWVGKSSNWAKFSCTSTLGMIHRGNKVHALTILQPYLREAEANSNPYCAGGAFFALGLIHANQYNAEIMNTFITNMQALGKNDVICHGISLGYGLVGMATADEGIYEELKKTLYEDSAIRGEAAALSVGLIMLGSANGEAIKDLLTYAHETQHEKIIRSIALALAFIMYGKEEAADTLFEQMVGDKDALLRYGAMHLLGLAYVGTENKNAIRQLLHYAVSDVDNDVRRAAVTNLGFILAKTPEKVKETSQALDLQDRGAAGR